MPDLFLRPFKEHHFWARVADIVGDADHLIILAGYLPKDAVIINVGRGDLIDTGMLLQSPLGIVEAPLTTSAIAEALLEALNSGHLRGAALDVTFPEPLPSGHPLWAHPQCIVTPHLSGDAKDEMDEIVRMCVDGVKRWREGGTVWNAVDVEKGY